MNTPILLETLARQALAGDRKALDTLVRALQDDIYRLALRMLWNREDAEDAVQEILVRIVTRLSQLSPRGIVLFDSLPLLITSEARVLLTLMGQIVLVVRALFVARPPRTA